MNARLIFALIVALIAAIFVWTLFSAAAERIEAAFSQVEQGEG